MLKAVGKIVTKRRDDYFIFYDYKFTCPKCNYTNFRIKSNYRHEEFKGNYKMICRGCHRNVEVEV